MVMVVKSFNLGNWAKLKAKLNDGLFSYSLSSKHEDDLRVRTDYLISLLDKQVFICLIILVIYR